MIRKNKFDDSAGHYFISLAAKDRIEDNHTWTKNPREREEKDQQYINRKEIALTLIGKMEN